MSSKSIAGRDKYVNALAQSLANGESLRAVPGLVKRIIEEEAWKERIVTQTGKPVTYKRFKDFVEDYPPEGLHTTINLLIDICQTYEDMEAVQMIAEVEAGKRGGANNLDGIGGKSGKTIVNNNNINIDKDEKPKQQTAMGTSTPATMRRLKKDAPEQLERVLAGEITPNKAMVEAGLRVPPFQMPQDPMKAGRYLAQRVDREWMEAMIRAYDDSCG